MSDKHLPNERSSSSAADCAVHAVRDFLEQRHPEEVGQLKIVSVGFRSEEEASADTASPGELRPIYYEWSASFFDDRPGEGTFEVEGSGRLGRDGEVIEGFSRLGRGAEFYVVFGRR